MISMKILLSKVDDADLDTLCTALIVNKKMGNRLAAIIRVREEEEKNGGAPLSELIGSIVD